MVLLHHPTACPQSEDVQPVKFLPPGKVLKIHKAPVGTARLVWFDAGEQGDFVWRRAYFKSDKGLVLLDAYQELSQVKWLDRGRTVTYRAVKATDSDEFTTYKVTYTIGAKRVTEKKMKVEKFDGGG